MREEIYVDLADGRRFWIAEGLGGRQEVVSGLDMPWSKPPQIVHGVDADTVTVFDRGGCQQSVAFLVTRLWRTRSEARRHVFEHAANHRRLPGRMVFIHHDEEGSDVWELIGHLIAVRPRQIGITTIISYEMVGAQWQRPDTY